MKMTTRSVWAITPEGFAAFVSEMNGSRFALKAYATLKPTTLGKNQSKVTVIPVKGVLTNDCSWCGTTYGSIADAAEKAAADPTVKRIVLAVDSPGGEVVGLPETASALQQAARQKPVHAMVEGMAASAGYWLASQASDITVTPSGEVGSVGVRMMHTDMSAALDDAGIKVTELFSGNYKTEWSPFKPLTDDAQDDMQKRLDAVHGNFIRAVGQGRGRRATAHISKARFGEGRMFDARDAVGHGLADSVQSAHDFYRALAQAKEGVDTSSVKRLRARLEAERLRF
jgi:signal peptide peptidase SppA